MALGVRVEGADRLAAKLTTIPTRVNSEVVSEMRDITSDLKEESQQIAPMLTGHLRAQAYTDVTSLGELHVEGEMGYEGPRDYLIPQHEGSWLNYRGEYGPKRIENYTTPGTGPKFVERVWVASLPTNKRRLMDAARRGLR